MIDMTERIIKVVIALKGSQRLHLLGNKWRFWRNFIQVFTPKSQYCHGITMEKVEDAIPLLELIE